MSQITDRAQELFMLGLKWNGTEYFKDDINVHWTEMSTMDDEEWKELINKLKKEIKRREINETSNNQ